MNEKLRGIVIGVGTLIELGCIATLAAIGLKRNKDAYNAEMKCCELELNNMVLTTENMVLKHEIKELKEQEVKEEEA